MLLAVLLLFSLSACSDDDSDPILPIDATVRIASYNVEDFGNTDAYTKIAGFIKDYSIDIVVFCEINPYDMAQFASTLSSAGVSMPYSLMDPAVAGTTNNEWYDDQIAIFSKWPITNGEWILQGNYLDPVSGQTVNAPRKIMKAKVVVTGNDGTAGLWFYGGHLKAMPDSEDRRRAQAYALSKYILANHNYKTDKIAIAGDMNTLDETPELDLNNKQSTLSYLSTRWDNDSANDFYPVNWLHLPEQPTYVNWQNYSNPSVLDHIILSPALYSSYVAGSVGVFTHSDGQSDHWPVYLELRL